MADVSLTRWPLLTPINKAFQVKSISNIIEGDRTSFRVEMVPADIRLKRNEKKEKKRV